MKFRADLSVAVAASGAIATDAASAAESGQSVESNGAQSAWSEGVADIVVTAGRRLSGLQRTPIAITTPGGNALRDNDASTFEVLSQGLSNVWFARNSGDLINSSSPTLNLDRSGPISTR